MHIIPLLTCLLTLSLVTAGTAHATDPSSSSRSVPSAADYAKPVAPAPTPSTARPTTQQTQTDTTLQRGALPKKVPNLAKPTDAEIAEANRIGNICRSSSEKDYFDCDCVSLEYLQRTSYSRAQKVAVNTFKIKNDAKRACPNQPAIAGRGYTNCMTWAPKMRTDYESFCSCYGNAYANEFAKRPAITINESKAVMSSAMKTCNIAAPVKERMTRNARIKEMEQKGIYEEMYPSAKDRPRTTIPPAPETPPSKLQPWQKIQKSLIDPSSTVDTNGQ